jgi:uncharacterized Zn-finger protein
MIEIKTLEKSACTERRYQIQETDLPLSCPPRDAGLWNLHPRVYLPIEEKGEVRCPYCSTTYVYHS